MSTTSLLVQSLPVLAQGAVLTVKFAVLSMFFGLIAGAMLALMGVSHSRTRRLSRSSQAQGCRRKASASRRASSSSP